MPQDRATAEELLAGVEKFLRNDVLAQLGGSSVYKCRVAANMLSIVQRELAQGPAADKAELERLEKLLGRVSEKEGLQAALDDLNQELCARIRSGKLDDQREAVVAHTRKTLIDKVGIANPKYAGLPK